MIYYNIKNYDITSCNAIICILSHYNVNIIQDNTNSYSSLFCQHFKVPPISLHFLLFFQVSAMLNSIFAIRVESSLLCAMSRCSMARWRAPRLLDSTRVASPIFNCWLLKREETHIFIKASLSKCFFMK